MTTKPKPYFGEKDSQIEQDSLVAFGIKLYSRYGKADEMAEMLEFASEVAMLDVADAVKEVFYNSKICICNFEFTRDELDEKTKNKILLAAAKTISAFDWFDEWWHNGYPDSFGYCSVNYFD